ncbi:hypothetical protein CR513_01753, partial [Mucuna pruriens]
MCLVLNFLLDNLLVVFERMHEEFKDIFPKLTLCQDLLCLIVLLLKSILRILKRYKDRYKHPIMCLNDFLDE